MDPGTASLWAQLAEMRLSSPPQLSTPPLQLPEPHIDPLTVKESDLERRCLGTLMDALRAVISYAHSSYQVSISFQVKRFDKAHGQVWVKVNPDEVPEGYDLKYLLQHIKFYENISRYAELLCTDDFKLRGTCQYFLDLQSRVASPKTEDPAGDISRVRETIARAAKWVQELTSVGLADRDVLRQLAEAQSKFRDLSYAVEKFSAFQQKQSESVRAARGWFPEKQQKAARSIHAQMSQILDDPEVCTYLIHVVGPRLGLIPFRVQTTY